MGLREIFKEDYMSEHNVYTIQLASKVSGVGIHTIRAWEKRYQAVVPKRGPTGRRQYTQVDVERLTLLCELCTLGHSIGQIANLPSQALEQMLVDLGKKTTNVTLDRGPLASNVNLQQSLMNLLLALENYKLDIMAHELGKINLVVNARDMVFQVLSPLLKEVAHKVRRGELSLSSEHALISLLKFQLGYTLYRKKEKGQLQRSAIVCAPEGELDEMNVLQAALLAEHYNYSLIYLGPNLPCGPLVDVIKATDAELVFLMMPMIAENATMNRMDKYLDKVLDTLKGSQRLVVNKARSFHPEKFLKSKQLIMVGGLLDLDLRLQELK